MLIFKIFSIVFLLLLIAFAMVCYVMFIKEWLKTKILPPFVKIATMCVMTIVMLYGIDMISNFLIDEFDYWKAFESLPEEKVEILVDTNAIIIGSDDEDIKAVLLDAEKGQTFYFQKGKNYACYCSITVGDKTFELEMSDVQNYLEKKYITIKPGGEKSSPLLCIFIAFFLCI